MQIFSTEPSDSQLATLLDAPGRSQSFRLTVTPGRLVAEPRGIPLWFVTLCGVIPAGLFTAYLAQKAAQQGLQPLELLGLVLGWPAAATIIALVAWMNRQTLAKGAFFVLDRDRRMLILPRQGIQIPDSQILGFVEVHAWHTVWDGAESGSEWLAELSVLVRTDRGEVARYPVLTCLHTRALTRLAGTLAEFFGVKRRLLRLNWRTRRRLRTEKQASV
jgi:hypothetical protein